MEYVDITVTVDYVYNLVKYRFLVEARALRTLLFLNAVKCVRPRTFMWIDRFYVRTSARVQQGCA